MFKGLLFIAAGVITWTLLEYVIHRFLGHMKKGKNPVRLEHQRHHAEAHYFAPMWKKLILATLVLSTSTLLTGLIFTFEMGFLFSLGLAGMYFLYEYTHRVFHIREPLIRYGLKMRKHHFYHHFGNPKLNHGVTTAFWDRVFGTYTKPDVVKVPNKLTMVWLKDNRHGLKQKYQRHFKVH